VVQPPETAACLPAAPPGPKSAGVGYGVIGGSLALIAALAGGGAMLLTGAPRRTAPAPAAGTAAAAPRRAADVRQATIARHVERLRDERAGDPCQAAYALADLGAREQVPELQRFVGTSAASDRKVCGAHALVSLGEGPAMLPHFVAWSRAGDDRLVDGAIVGFGQVGPSAAHEAVPLLQEALAAVPSAARRRLIVSTLARLGPAAVPALRLLVDDPDAQVRTAAQKALERR
jgi:hypothetical protein